MIFTSALTVTAFAAAALAGSIVPRGTTNAPADVIDKIQLHAALPWRHTSTQVDASRPSRDLRYYSNLRVQPGRTGTLTIPMNATKEVNIVFRGTLSLRNGQTNADSTPTPVSWPGCTGCTVHHGFYTNYLDAKNYTNGFATAFNAASALGYKVNCVGHSLGAAVAAMQLPLGWTLALAKTSSSKVYRVVNGGDSVPAQVLDATYVHHGVGYKRDGSNARTLVCASDTDPECAGGSNVVDQYW
ncbi:Lipase (class 3) [Rhizoctonia solani]|uniref:Lipase (Class 3) n=1 Tax=Rhizoctonia solani TaxID=456999 RepID=A0A8H8SWP1_9AGAM|nr:Lipase (class 3) [Rhizoctonia solani]QRW19722.1 Lipase (class 3) [Rhizoctonia solani]